jgi:hypothetical protein
MLCIQRSIGFVKKCSGEILKLIVCVNRFGGIKNLYQIIFINTRMHGFGSIKVYTQISFIVRDHGFGSIKSLYPN